MLPRGYPGFPHMVNGPANSNTVPGNPRGAGVQMPHNDTPLPRPPMSHGPTAGSRSSSVAGGRSPMSFHPRTSITPPNPHGMMANGPGRQAPMMDQTLAGAQRSHSLQDTSLDPRFEAATQGRALRPPITSSVPPVLMVAVLGPRLPSTSGSHSGPGASRMPVTAPNAADTRPIRAIAALVIPSGPSWGRPSAAVAFLR